MITAVYADGGVIGHNPSDQGGTYAWCATDEQGEFVTGNGGIILSTVAGDLSLAGEAFPIVDGPVTNNVSEFVAAVFALESLPDGWTGKVYSDSQITLGRLFRQWKLAGLPASWVARAMEAVRRLGPCTPILLQGHPTAEDLAFGFGAKRGFPVSRWNVWCDQCCTEQARNYLKAVASRSAA